MQIYVNSSSFHDLPITTFWYPTSDSRPVVLLLKGIYSSHDPQSSVSWEAELMARCKDRYHFICINTARRENTSKDQKSEEAFIGKTYMQECDDVRKGFETLERAKVMPEQYKLIILGNSFGGTVLLGLPEILQRAASVIFVGSGCGRSATTTKPLLSTMLKEDILLANIQAYRGTFIFVRGDTDTVVPKESQDKIIQHAVQAKERIVCDVRNASHDLTVVDPHKDEPTDRASLLGALLAYCSRSKTSDE